eukprot:5298002-Prymnesium_polylepis.1
MVHPAVVVGAREQRQHRVFVSVRRARRGEREHRHKLLLLGGVGMVGGAHLRCLCEWCRAPCQPPPAPQGTLRAARAPVARPAPRA